MTRERANDDLGTPRWILDLVRSMGPIALDPCSNEWSLVGALRDWSLHRGENGLEHDWFNAAGEVGSIFVNPPYSKPMPWCLKASEAARKGAEVFVLVRLDPTTRWTEELRRVATARCDFSRRISFEGGKHKAGAMASVMFYAGPWPYLFCHTFQEVGEVRVYR